MNINKVVFILIFVAFFSYKSQSQDIEKKNNGIYKSPDGLLYVNQHKPLYLKISSSPDRNAPKHLLKSFSTPKYSTPLRFGREGYNYVKTPSQVDTATKKPLWDKKDIIWEVYVDGSAPKTEIIFGNAQVKTEKGNVFRGANTTISLKSYDKWSGVKTIFYAVNSDNFQEYFNSLQLNEEKTYQIQYYAIDNVGNKEKIQSESFTVDLSSPTTEYDVKGNYINSIFSGNGNIALSSKDASSGVSNVYYSIDNSQEIRYLKPIQFSNLKEGEHVITYYSVDVIGNKEAVKTFTFTIDKKPPMVIEEMMGDYFLINGKEYSSGRSKLKLTAVDDKAGVKNIFYSINGAAYVLYEKPFYLPNSKGALDIKYYAIDNVENKGKAGREGQAFGTRAASTGGFYLDLTGPELMYEYVGSKIKIRDTVVVGAYTKIKLKATDEESGLQKITFSYNKGEETNYDSLITIREQGKTTLDITGYDNVNNTNVNSMYFTADKTAPEITPIFGMKPTHYENVSGENLAVYPTHLILYLSATDNLAGTDKILYAMNDMRESLYNTPISGFKNKTTYKIKIKAIDKLGNYSEKLIQFYISD